MEILNQIQADLLNLDVSASNALRKAKVLAYQLASDKLRNWVSSEFDGYKSRDELPEYRIFKVVPIGKWTNGYWLATNRMVPLYRIDDGNLKDYLTTYHAFDGIKAIEELASSDEKHFIVPSDITTLTNRYVSENGFAYMEIEYPLGVHHFRQVLDTVKNRLLDFVLELNETWKPTEPPPAKDTLNNLVSVYIYNTAQGGNMSTVFDQRGQHVNYQYNATGDINIENVRDITTLASELEKLSLELENAKNAQAISNDIALEAQFHLLQASKEAEKEKPRKNEFIKHVEKAKVILTNISAVGGLVMALEKLIEIAQKLF